MSKEPSAVAEDVKNKNVVKPQLNIILTTDEDDERPVYISGNFNNWVTQDKKFEMERVGHGLYRFKFDLNFVYPDELLYKFTRGDWSEVEIDKYGNRTENRSCIKQNGIHKEHVAKWRKNWLPFKSMFLPKMKVRLSINMEGKHNERYWSDEFPKAIEWMYFSDINE